MPRMQEMFAFATRSGTGPLWRLWLSLHPMLIGSSRGFLLGGVAAIAQNRSRFVRQAFVHYDTDVGVPWRET